MPPNSLAELAATFRRTRPANAEAWRIALLRKISIRENLWASWRRERSWGEPSPGTREESRGYKRVRFLLEGAEAAFSALWLLSPQITALKRDGRNSCRGPVPGNLSPEDSERFA